MHQKSKLNPTSGDAEAPTPVGSCKSGPKPYSKENHNLLKCLVILVNLRCSCHLAQCGQNELPKPNKIQATVYDGEARQKRASGDCHVAAGYTPVVVI
jgi:hypothetical protein